MVYPLEIKHDNGFFLHLNTHKKFPHLLGNFAKKRWFPGTFVVVVVTVEVVVVVVTVVVEVLVVDVLVVVVLVLVVWADGRNLRWREKKWDGNDKTMA